MICECKSGSGFALETGPGRGLTLEHRRSLEAAEPPDPFPWENPLSGNYGCESIRLR